jgi:DNA-binding transcriptional LysR family regulator
VQLREMRWVPIAEEDAVSEMWLVWSKHHEQSHAAQRFKQQLMASAGRHFREKWAKMCGKSQG